MQQLNKNDVDDDYYDGRGGGDGGVWWMVNGNNDCDDNANKNEINATKRYTFNMNELCENNNNSTKLCSGEVNERASRQQQQQKFRCSQPFPQLHP